KNVLVGNDGNNILDGNGGGDTLIGGKGNDTYIVRNEDDVVVEHDKEGTDTVKAYIDYTLTDNVENLILEGNDDIRGTGNELSNTITGNAGNNVLDGGKGADKLIGGKGDDTYIVDLIVKGTGTKATVALEDTVTEKAKEGTDTLQLRMSDEQLGEFSGKAAITLAANLENLDARGVTNELNISLTGNGEDNIIWGNDGNNQINGGAGNDVLIGGKGQDNLTGGAGRDKFVFEAGDSDSDANGTTIDSITDFKGAEDSIFFSHLDIDETSVVRLGSSDGSGNVATCTLWPDLANQAGASVVIGYDKNDAYVFVDTDGIDGIDTAIKLVGVKGDAAINAINVAGGD